MRELKYRARHGGTWHYFTLRGLVVDAGPYYWLNNPDTIIDEFTSLHDKNGKEIYEGDIVSIESGYLTTVFEVYWSDDRWGLRHGDEEYDNGDYYHGDQIDWRDAEIIGNVHENPEILTN